MEGRWEVNPTTSEDLSISPLKLVIEKNFLFSQTLPGQFLYEEVGVAEAPGGGGEPSAVLKVKERSVPVVKKTRRIYGGAQSVDCWFARNNAAKLIDGRYQDYLAPHMFDTGDGRRGGSATNGA